MSDRTRLLRHISIFGALRPETIDFLLERATRVETPAGELLVRDKTPGGDLLILESGRAEVFKERRAPEGGPTVRVRLAELGRGDCIGETSILAVMPRSASVEALEDCVALRLRCDDLLALHDRDLGEFAILVMNLGREAARRLWVANELLLDQMIG